MASRKRILKITGKKTGVFGANGFIGLNFIPLAKEAGLSMRFFDTRPVLRTGEPAVACDFRQPRTYREELRGLENLVLLVSASVPSTFAGDIAAETEQNVLPYARLLREADMAGVRHVLFLSSGGAVYGEPRTHLASETHPLRPANPYGAGKAMIETLIRTAARTASWTYTILRPSNPVGRWQYPGRGQGLAAEAVHAALTGAPLPVWGDGSVIRNYFDVRDLCAAMIACLQQRPAALDAVFNVAGAEESTILDVVRAVEDILDARIRLVQKPARKIDVPRIMLDTRRIERALGWRPRYALRDAILENASFQRNLPGT